MSLHSYKRASGVSTAIVKTSNRARSTMVTRGKAAQLKEREVHEVADILLSFSKLPRVHYPLPAANAAATQEIPASAFPYTLFLLPSASPLASASAPQDTETPTAPAAAQLPLLVESIKIPDYVNQKPKSSIKKKRKRTTKAQLAVLEKVFESNKTPNREAREELGRLLGMSARSVQIWYQNRRSKLKRGYVRNSDKTCEAKSLFQKDSGPIPNVCFHPNMVAPQLQGLPTLPLLAPKGMVKRDTKMPCKLPTVSCFPTTSAFPSFVPCLSVHSGIQPSEMAHTSFPASSLVQVP